jgi:F-type H+-transporting ATPase subunit delta
VADDSKNTDVGGRYAQALFELADAQGRLPQVEADLKGLEQARGESADFARLLASPAFSAEDKGRALKAVAQAAGVDALTAKFLGVIAANGRASGLPAIAKAFAALAAKRRGAVAAEVVTAAPLSEAQSQGLLAALRHSLGRDPELSIRVDPALLGGIKVRVGSRLYDASLKTRLDQLTAALARA